MKTTFFLPIAIDIYTPDPAKDSDPDREWFTPLPKVAADVESLRQLFSTERFQRAGFAAEMRVSGAAFEILHELRNIAGRLSRARCNGLVVLWSGHGESLADGTLQLACREDQSPMKPGDGILPTQLARSLLAIGAPFLYLVLDVCHSGAASTDILKAISDFWAASVPAERGFSLLCAAGPESAAYDGALVPILKQVLECGPSVKAREIIESEQTGHWSEKDAWLSAALINSTISKELRAARLPAALSLLSNDVQLFPNPLYKPASPPRIVQQARRAFLAADANTHFLSKARGMDPTEPGWFFSGRTTVNRRILERLNATGTIVVITGSTGSGKSAILGRLALLSDREAALNAGWSEKDDPYGTVPPQGWATAALHLRRLTVVSLLDRLSELLLGPEIVANSDIDYLLKQVGERAMRPLVIFDALDESLEPSRISNDVIVPLVRAGWRILLGTRRSALNWGKFNLLAIFAKLGHATLEDLDEDSETAADIFAYVQQRLRKSPESPYLDREGDDPDIAQIAFAVAEFADGNFLYARITADTLVRLEKPLELRPGWQELYLGRGLDDTFKREFAVLDRRFNEHFGRMNRGASDLSRALAWGRGAGLPLWDDIWPRVASAASQADPSYTREHAQWLLVEGGQYIVEAGENDQAVYRLFHESLTDFFHRDVDADFIESSIFSELARLALEKRKPNAYVKRYLAAHAASAKTLSRIIHDPWLTVLCEPFLRYCDDSLDINGSSVMRVYLSVAHRLGSVPEQNAAYLLLGAHLYGHTELESGIRALSLNLPFTVGWCDYDPPKTPSLFFENYNVAGVHRIAWHPTANVVAVADPRGVRYFHVEGGTSAGTRIELDLRTVVGLAWELVGGEPVLAVAGNTKWKSSPRLWLIGADNVPREVALPTAAELRGLVWGRIRNREVLMVAANDGLWISDADAPSEFIALDTGNQEPFAVCFGTPGGTPAFLVLYEKGVFAWDGENSRKIIEIERNEGIFEPNEGGFEHSGIAFLAGLDTDWIATILDLRTTYTSLNEGVLKTGNFPFLGGAKAIALFRDASNDPWLAACGWGQAPIRLYNLRTGVLTLFDGHEHDLDDFAIQRRGHRTTMITAGQRIKKWFIPPVIPQLYPKVPHGQGQPHPVFGRGSASDVVILSSGARSQLQSRSLRSGKTMAESQLNGTVMFATLDNRAIILVHGPSKLSVCDPVTLTEIKAIEGGTLPEQLRALRAAGVLLDRGGRLGGALVDEVRGETVLSADMDGRIQVRSLVSGKLLCQAPTVPRRSYDSVAWGIWRGEPIFAVSRDGSIAFLRFSESTDSKVEEAIPPLQGIVGTTRALSFGRVDGRVMLAVGGVEGFYIWDLETRQTLSIGLDHKAKSLALSDSGILVIAADRGTITLHISSSWLTSAVM